MSEREHSDGRCCEGGYFGQTHDCRKGRPTTNDSERPSGAEILYVHVEGFRTKHAAIDLAGKDFIRKVVAIEDYEKLRAELSARNAELDLLKRGRDKRVEEMGAQAGELIRVTKELAQARAELEKRQPASRENLSTPPAKAAVAGQQDYFTKYDEECQCQKDCDEYRKKNPECHGYDFGMAWRLGADYLRKERDELKTELSRERDIWHELHNKETGVCAQLKAEIINSNKFAQDQEDRLATALEALEFYAAGKHIETYWATMPEGHMKPTHQVATDDGAIARAAIEKVKK